MNSIRLLCLLAAPCALLGAAAPAAPATAPGFTLVKSAGGISEYVSTANRMNVLLKEDHSTPVVTFMVTYRVGSRHEVTGTTGATHLLEHLMFKGSEAYNHDRGTGFDTLLDRIGARNNASTWLDRTNYYEQLASNQLELAMQLESDRMRRLLLREKDREPEMTVVRNEFERGENNPIQALDKEIGAAAYIAHPYHHPTIGWRSDIEKVTLEKLREFYDTYYWPNNATITVIGDFDSAATLAMIRRHFGRIGASPKPIPAVYTVEPPQQGPRRVQVSRPGEIGVVGIAYKSPAGLDPDYPAVSILTTILTDGKTSRLYRALTDRNLTLDVSAYAGFHHDPSLLNIYAALNPDPPVDPSANPVARPVSLHQRVERIILEEIETLKRDGVTEAELARAINKDIAGTAFARDGSFAIASELNEEIAAGDWTAYVTLPEKTKAVTAADVQRVARKYLQESQSTTGYFIPVAEPPAQGAPAAQGPAPSARVSLKPEGPHFYRDPEDVSASPTGVRPPSPRLRRASAPLSASATAAGGGSGTGGALIAPSIVRREINGIDVLSVRTSLADVVTISGSLPAGDVFNPRGRPAIASMVAGMLDKGTTGRDKFAVAQQLEDVGASISFSSNAHDLLFEAKTLKKDLPLVLGLLVEQLRTPAFSAEEFEKLKRQLIGEYQQQLEEPDFRAGIALSRALFPEGHPNRQPDSQAYLADLANARLEEIKAFHAANFGPANMIFVAVGDVDNALLDANLRTATAGWSGGSAIPEAARATPPEAARVERVAMPGKASVVVLLGQPSGLRYTDPDRIALSFATQVLGGNYFSSRLMATVRNVEGLTYGIGAGVASDTYSDGRWSIQGTFAPALLEKGLASTQRELKRFVATGLTANELRDFKNAATGSYKLALGTSEGLAGQLLVNVQRGLPLAWVDDYSRTIDALTLEKVNAAIKKYLNPDRMITVMAGTFETP